MATYEGAMKYLELMKEKFLKDIECESNGVDQGLSFFACLIFSKMVLKGMHNVFVYNGDLQKKGVDVVLYSLEEGPVATLGYMNVMRKNLWGDIINENNEPYALVHQVDRSPSYKKFLEGQYATPKNLTCIRDTETW